MSIEHPDENLDTGNLDTGNLDTGNQPAGTDRIEDDRRRLRRLSTLLDSQFRIPGTQIRFGVDPIIGVIPGLGDSAGLVASGVVLAQAIQLGARGATLARMILNVVLDGVVGTVPLLGTVFDVVYKANNRNVALLERHVTDPAATASASGRALVLTAVVIIVILFVAVALVVAAIVALLSWLF
ncbi:MAG: DUF4112 domain-containing protein [Acidimicrobiales bacterium]|nr:DUF4112 domain-containing protein [Acidimicrobiales bacterium]